LTPPCYHLEPPATAAPFFPDQPSRRFGAAEKSLFATTRTLRKVNLAANNAPETGKYKEKRDGGKFGVISCWT
jgi:hypothetical protein